METWKTIVGYENYSISNKGKVRNDVTKRILSLFPVQGYLMVNLTGNNGEKKLFYVHRLVGQAFVDNPNDYKEINHKNGIKEDNNVENLQWCTRSENIRHAYAIRLMKPLEGEKSGMAKLTNEDVVQIRELRSTGIILQELSDLFGVSKSVISNVSRHKSWKHV